MNNEEEELRIDGKYFLILNLFQFAMFTSCKKRLITSIHRKKTFLFIFLRITHARSASSQKDTDSFHACMLTAAAMNRPWTNQPKKTVIILCRNSRSIILKIQIFLIENINLLMKTKKINMIIIVF